MPGLFARAAELSARADVNDHVLVVVELSGGNDGLNTLIPFEDALYYKNRRTLGVPKKDVLRLSDQVGLHPRMGPMAELFRAGRLSVVQGVGYPKPDRSHFRSMEIWHTARDEGRPPTSGWLGRYLDVSAASTRAEALPALALTDALPHAFQAERTVVPVVAEVEAFSSGGEPGSASALRRALSTTTEPASGPIPFLRRQAGSYYRTAEQLEAATKRYKAGAEYPEGELAAQLRRAAQILSGGLGARVLFASHDGYDTHADQADEHGALLEHLAASLAAFDKDLKAQGLDEKVVVLVFSEFGRRVDENASKGTDHGAASCLFLSGAKVRGGLAGQYPSLKVLGEGDLVYQTDFRSVYATVLENWLGCASEPVLGARFPTLEIL
jgi:uncharacterized protein (DUF1501 family)